MIASVEKVDGGYLVEVQLDITDPTYSVMQTKRNLKAVCTTYPEVENLLRELFLGKQKKEEPVDDLNQDGN